MQCFTGTLFGSMSRGSSWPLCPTCSYSSRTTVPDQAEWEVEIWPLDRCTLRRDDLFCTQRGQEKGYRSTFCRCSDWGRRAEMSSHTAPQLGGEASCQRPPRPVDELWRPMYPLHLPRKTGAGARTASEFSEGKATSERRAGDRPWRSVHLRAKRFLLSCLHRGHRSGGLTVEIGCWLPHGVEEGWWGRSQDIGT